MMHSAQTKDFREWVDEQIRALTPGTVFPSMRKIGSRWGLSETTVRRILREYRDQDRLRLIPGKGAMIPLDKSTAGEPAHVSSSTRDLADYLLKGISMGVFRKGRRLPSNKRLAIQFGVAPATVTKAYRILMTRDLVVKIGRSYWVSSDTPHSPDHKGTVVFTNCLGNDCGNLYQNDQDERYGTMMGLACRRMERELLINGFELQYQPFSEFVASAQNPNRIEREHVAGVYVHGCQKAHLEEVSMGWKWYARHGDASGATLLVSLLRGSHKQLPSNARRVSWGNILTTVARRLAQIAAVRGYAEVRYIFHEENEHMENVLKSIRIYNEIREINAEIDFRILVKPKPRLGGKNEFFKRIYEYRAPQLISQRLSKYGFVDFQKFEKMVYIEKEINFENCPDRKTLVIFAETAQAFTFLQYCRSTMKRVPSEIGIVCLGNDPRYLHHNISCCIPDWETNGYLMAHSLMGDLPVAKTRKGFIRPQALFLDRGTM